MAISDLPTPGIGLVRDAEVWEALEEVQSFLPFVTGYLKYTEACTDAPLAFQLLGAYGLLAATAPADLQFADVLAGQPVYPNLWTLAVGQSGDDRKTTAIGLARKMLEVAAPAVIGSEPSSAEAFVTSFHDQPVQTLIIPDMGAFLAQAQGEGNYFRKVKAKFVDVYDCGPIHKRNAKKETVVACQSPRFSIMAGVNPGFLETHTERADWTSGYMSRHFTLFAARERFLVLRAPWATSFGQQLAEHLGKMSRWGVRGPCVGITPEALDLYERWSARFRARLAGAAAGLSGQSSRTVSLALKLALLSAWDYGEPRQGPWELQIHHVRAGINFAELHWRSVVQVAEFSVSSRDVRDRRAVLSALRPDLWTAAGEILLRCPTVGLQKRVNEVLSTLVASGEAESKGHGTDTYYRAKGSGEILATSQGRVLTLDQLQETNPLLTPAAANGAPKGSGPLPDQTFPAGPSGRPRE